MLWLPWYRAGGMAGMEQAPLATRAGLSSWWDLEEASGAAADAKGSNTLSATNNPVSAAGKIGNARAFVSASSQYLSVASNATLQTTSSGFWLASWVNFTTLKAASLISKGSFAGYNNADYSLEFTTSGNFFNFSVGTGSASATATDATARTTGTWYFVFAWYDPSTGNLNIQVNNGAVTSQALGAAPVVTANAFALGAWPTPGNYLNGALDSVAFGKPASIGSIITELGTQLYNAGSGRSYAQFAAL